MDGNTFTREGEYKGNPTITIVMGTYETKSGEEKENTFSFGIRKAKAILDHIEEIKNFAEKHES